MKVYNAELTSCETSDGLQGYHKDTRKPAQNLLFCCAFDCWYKWNKLDLNDVGITTIEDGLQLEIKEVLGAGALTFKIKEKLFKVEIVDLENFDYDTYYWFDEDEFLISCTRIK